MPAALVLDASVALALSLPDDRRGRLGEEAVALVADATAVVPAHWHAEVGNGLLMAVRRGRIQAEALPDLLADLALLPVELDDAGNRTAWEEPLRLAMATGLTLYDALYLELALRRRLPLASHDGPLRHAATAHGVRVLAA